jgi:hypothetical protein
MSEHMAEQSSGEAGSPSAGPAVPNASETPAAQVAASAQGSMPTSTDAESPKLVPEQGGAAEFLKAEAPRLDAPRLDASKADAAKPDAPKPDAPKPDAPKADAPKADAPRASGKIMIMSAGDRGWDSKGAGPEPDTHQNSPMFGKRRLAALAAVVALAAIAGALGGALATAGLGHLVGDDTATSGNRTLEAAVARIDADIANLKLGVEHTSKVGMSQFNKTSDRLDKVEKAQAEPAARLARLSDAVDKLRAAPVAAAAAAAPAAAREVTGSIAPPAATPPAAPKSELAKSEAAKSEAAKSEAAKSETAKSEAAKPEVARLPTVEGWVLRDVDHGAALIEGRRGMFEVFAGDPIPGLGRVDAIRRQDGRWVVVTSKGLIVTR